VQEGETIATRTNPRIGQALQVLRDLGAIVDNKKPPHRSTLSPLGQQLLKEVLIA
jgi:hypothetical protein